MDCTTREAKVSAAFIAMADTLKRNFDVNAQLQELVDTCAEIFSIDTCLVMLADANGELQVVVTTSNESDAPGIMLGAGNNDPFVECFTTGDSVSLENLETSGARWPEFRGEALRLGFSSLLVIPLRLRGQTIATLGLFGPTPRAFPDRDISLARSLADVATIAILQDRFLREGHVLADQLHRALDSRVVIEKAKGVIAQSAALTMDDAFHSLRTFARSHNLTIRSVSERITSREMDVSVLFASSVFPA